VSILLITIGTTVQLFYQNQRHLMTLDDLKRPYRAYLLHNKCISGSPPEKYE